MRVLALCGVLGVLAVGLIAYVGQVHHTNGCTTYGNELAAAVDSPGSPSFHGLPASVVTVARKSDQAFEARTSVDWQTWDHYTQTFVAEGLALHGC